jgi:FkbM family methyltransferase
VMLRDVLATLRFIRTHPLGSQRPLESCLRYARWQIESRICKSVTVDWIDGAKLVASNGMTGATGNVYCGLHEFVDMAFVLHLLRPGDLFLDVGANVGSYTILASAVCGAESVSIEPDPVTMGHLRRNAEANHIVDRVTFIEAAVGSQAGTAKFTVGRDTTNRMATEDDVDTRDIEVRTIDDLLNTKSPVLIKMDVEGHETAAMSGASATIRDPSLLAILIETVEDEVMSGLIDAGFSQVSYDPFTRTVAREWGPSLKNSSNSLFVRDIKTCQRRVTAAAYRDVHGQRL